MSESMRNYGIFVDTFFVALTLIYKKRCKTKSAISSGFRDILEKLDAEIKSDEEISYVEIKGF